MGKRVSTLAIIALFLFPVVLLAQDDSLTLEAPVWVRDTLIIIGVGDIMQGTDYPSARYLPPSGSCQGLMRDVLWFFQGADVVFGNLEGVFAGTHGTPKNCKNPETCYVFRKPVHFVDCLTDAGFNLLSVANNHVNDFGPEGRDNTAKVLEKAGIAFAGFQNNPYTILEKEGIKYGFTAFAPHTGTNDMRNLNRALSIVKHLDTITDIVIVSFHSGAEGRDHQHVTRKDEIFLGHNRGNVYDFSHQVIDAGADIVFGHGPHVARAIEVYNSRFIAYSLGNFSTYSRFNISGPNGLAPAIKVFTDREGNFREAKIYAAVQEGEGITRGDPTGKVIKKIQELSDIDFPGHNLLFEEDGRVILTLPEDMRQR